MDFAIARAARTNADRLSAIRAEVERTIADRSFRLTEILNLEPDLQIPALEYLHGDAGRRRTGSSVRVRLEIKAPIVKDYTVEVKVGGNKPRFVGGSAQLDRLPDGRILRRTLQPGSYEMSTDEAVPLLYKHGVGVARVDSRPGSDADRRAWVVELPMDDPEPAPLRRPTRGPAAQAATG